MSHTHTTTRTTPKRLTLSELIERDSITLGTVEEVRTEGRVHHYTVTLAHTPPPTHEEEGSPRECECDNTHHQHNTVCRWCWARGRRHWDDPEVSEWEGEIESLPFAFHTTEPTGPAPRRVLSALLAEGYGAEQAFDALDWAGEMGFATDTPEEVERARAMYEQVEEHTRHLRSFLGSEARYEEYLYAAAE